MAKADKKVKKAAKAEKEVKKVKGEKPLKKGKTGKENAKIGKKDAAKLGKAPKNTKGGDAPSKKKAKPAKGGSPKFEYKLKDKEFKTGWYEVIVKTEKDGLLAGNIQAKRYVGQIEADKPANKVANLADYDTTTLIGIQARLAGATFHATGKPSSKGVPSRLTANTEFVLHIRASASKEGLVKASIQRVFAEEANKKGVVKLVELDKKTNVDVKRLRRANRTLSGAFVHAVMPPKPEPKSRRAKAEEE